jgi:hypothetical protein
VVRGSEPSARQAERSGKRGGWGRQLAPANKKKPEGGLRSRYHPRVRKRKAPGRAPADGGAGIALGRAGVWGQRPHLLLNVDVRIKKHRFFLMALSI